MVPGVALALSLNMGSLIQNVLQRCVFFFFFLPKCGKYNFALVFQQ